MTKNIPFHRLQPPLDCTKLETTRGIFIGSRILENTEGLDFEGSVLYRCYPSNLKGALEIEPSVTREELTSEGLDLSGVDFTEMTLNGLVFSGAILEQAEFSHAELEGADFSNAYLPNVDFTCANLSDAKFIGADLTDAHFEEATIKNTDFTGANLEDSNFEEVKYFGASIMTAEQVKSIEKGLVVCDECETIDRPEEFYISEDGTYCYSCGAYCDQCDKLTAENSLVCNAEGEYLCEDCITIYKCANCKYESEYLENFENADSGELLCLACAVHCKECGETVSKDDCEVEDIGRTKKYYHNNCYTQCDICEEFIVTQDFQSHLQDCSQSDPEEDD